MGFLRKIRSILTGWLRAAKLIDTTSAEKKLSELRLKKCENCKSSYKSKLLYIINGEDVETNALICNECKCPCLEKSLVPGESCPIKRW